MTKKQKIEKAVFEYRNMQGEHGREELLTFLLSACSHKLLEQACQEFNIEY